MGCPICGPLCSRYYMILSVWAIFMLGILGVFFWVKSPGLFEDLAMAKDEWKTNNFSKAYAYEKYEQNAVNCWIAAGIYLVLFVFSFVQFRMNNRSNYEMS